MGGRIRVWFDDRQVTDVGLVLLTLTNSGSQTVRKEDFHEPLAFCFHGSTGIISAEVPITLPPNLRVGIEIDNQPGEARRPPELKVLPLLLNSGDSVTFKVLISDFAKVNLGLRYHITDIPHIAERRRQPLNQRWKYATAVMVNTLGVSALVLVGGSARSWATSLLIIACVTPLFMLPYLVEMVDSYLIRSRTRRMFGHDSSTVASGSLNQADAARRSED